jgi:hypothetical protein
MIWSDSHEESDESIRAFDLLPHAAFNLRCGTG